MKEYLKKMLIALYLHFSMFNKTCTEKELCELSKNLFK